MLDGFFKQRGIEYYAVLDYKDCRETARHIIERESFTPASVIIYLMPYYVSGAENMSLYATSLDYHLAIGEVNNALREHLQAHFAGSGFKGYGDHSPIDERSAALITSLGVLGRNGLLINERYGSYVFIGDALTDIPAELLGKSPISEVKYCEGCGKCLASCPTGILRAQGDFCLSMATQKKGELTDEEVSLMRKVNTVWGCDLCQSVCPHNRTPLVTPIDFFKKERITCLTSEILASMSKEELRRRAFGWRGRAVPERNLSLLGY